MLWSAVECGGELWSAVEVESYGVLVECNGVQWSAMECHRVLWIAVECCGVLWSIVDPKAFVNAKALAVERLEAMQMRIESMPFCNT